MIPWPDVALFVLGLLSLPVLFAGFVFGVGLGCAIAFALRTTTPATPDTAPVPASQDELRAGYDLHAAKRAHRPPPRRLGSEICGETDSAIADQVLDQAGYPESMR